MDDEAISDLLFIGRNPTGIYPPYTPVGYSQLARSSPLVLATRVREKVSDCGFLP
ncbi:MAG: hypothetical protein V7K14_10025 [Nostoc sp.]|uniref:hypothetical protein n=1 Tax=Nostoc sp. TaxID=1180 RepID=UPI002FF6FA0D